LYLIRKTSEESWEVGKPISRRLRRFRDTRLGLLMEGKAPVTLVDGPRVVLHVLPEATLADEARPAIIAAAAKEHGLPPFGEAGRSGRCNFDGCVSYTEFSSDGTRRTRSSSGMDRWRRRVSSLSPSTPQ
jgi:hypothetical protein